MTSTFSFHAQVAAEAIEKVGRLFNASISDILNELLQNARRAGATKILIDEIIDPRFGDAIRITDDGAGLDDPRSLFSLGHSDWSETLSRSEDAAGMGFFALANRGATIIAQQKGTAHSWVIEATHDAFHGKELVSVLRGPKYYVGVTIIFPAEKGENYCAAVRNAARFFPVPVLFNGEKMDSDDFLGGAGHVEEWNGIRIGVFDDEPSGFGHNANFHGVTLRIPLPTLAQSWHRTCYARIDMVSCAHLKLVLPARKEVVRDAMYDALVEEIHRVYFRLVASRGPHSLSFKDYQHGRTLGIDLQEAEPKLRPFSPSVADYGMGRLLAPEPIQANALLYDGNGPVEEQNVARAITRLTDAPAIFEPNQKFAGYKWYDQLERASLKAYRKSVDGVVSEIESADDTRIRERPDGLEIELNVHNGVTSRCWVLETDLIVTGPDCGCLDEMSIRIARQSTITPRQLQVFLTDALFSPSDDAEAGSYQQQEEWFADEAEDLSICLLQSEAAADLNALVRVARRELVWRVPKDTSVIIRIYGRNVSIEGLPSSDQSEGSQ